VLALHRHRPGALVAASATGPSDPARDRSDPMWPLASFVAAVGGVPGMPCAGRQAAHRPAAAAEAGTARWAPVARWSSSSRISRTRSPPRVGAAGLRHHRHAARACARMTAARSAHESSHLPTDMRGGHRGRLAPWSTHCWYRRPGRSPTRSSAGRRGCGARGRRPGERWPGRCPGPRCMFTPARRRRSRRHLRSQPRCPPRRCPPPVPRRRCRTRTRRAAGTLIASRGPTHRPAPQRPVPTGSRPCCCPAPPAAVPCSRWPPDRGERRGRLARSRTTPRRTFDHARTCPRTGLRHRPGLCCTCASPDRCTPGPTSATPSR